MSKDNREECPDWDGTGIIYQDEMLRYVGKQTCDRGTGKVTIDSGADVCEWVSVEEKRPNEYVDVLFSLKNVNNHKWVQIGYLCEGQYYVWNEETNGVELDEDTVTHWQPLPKPPITIKGE